MSAVSWQKSFFKCSVCDTIVDLIMSCYSIALLCLKVSLFLQLQALLKVIFTNAVPVIGGVMIVIAVWSLLVSSVSLQQSPANL